jgi:hypothetical protein
MKVLSEISLVVKKGTEIALKLHTEIAVLKFHFHIIYYLGDYIYIYIYIDPELYLGGLIGDNVDVTII